MYSIRASLAVVPIQHNVRLWSRHEEPWLGCILRPSGRHSVLFCNYQYSVAKHNIWREGAFTGNVNQADVVNGVPDGGTTMTLLGLGLVGLGTLRRKFLI